MSDDKVTKSQHARFVEAAREAGADVNADAADLLMGRLAKTPPEPKAATKNAAPKGGAVGYPKEPNGND